MNKKILALAGALGAACLGSAVFLGSPLSASFRDTKGAPGSTFVSTGQVAIGSASGTYSESISGFPSGATQVKYVNISNSGTLPFGSLDFKVAATGNLVNNPVGSFAPIPTGVLNPDGTVRTYTPTWDRPLQMKVDYCSSPWDGSGNCSGFTLPGSWSVPSGQVLNVYSTSQGAPQTPPGSSVFLKISYYLPVDAGLEYQNTSAAISYSMTARQRDKVTLP